MKIDNLEFVKFVLANRPMDEAKKKIFLDAAPKMTEDEKAEYILKVMAIKAAKIASGTAPKEQK